MLTEKKFAAEQFFLMQILKNTIEKLFGLSKFPKEFANQAKSVRLNSTSCQVYIGLKKGVSIPDVGDLIFTSESPSFSTDELTDFHTTSRTFSVYYPDTRPDRKEPRYSIVASINAKWQDWQKLSDEDYAQAKNRLCKSL